jgi:pimeloyl-ACP methyl ester carboxylesterase
MGLGHTISRGAKPRPGLPAILGAAQSGRMIERSLSCLGPHGFHRLNYCEWAGAAGAPALLCLHGLTRNAHDFDPLAESLAGKFRVVAADMPGRGKSQWLDHAEDYALPLYLADTVALIARLGVAAVDIVGTSMGGMIGMLLAALPENPIRRLVINDVGPLIAKEGLARTAGYVGLDPGFADLAALEAGLRAIFAGFGPIDDAHWREMARHSARRKPDGNLGLAYDPKIAAAFALAPLADIDLWASYDVVKCPTLVLRGGQSDLLRAADAKAMTQRGPRAKLVEFPDCGHAPSLTRPEQIAAITDFLSRA